MLLSAATNLASAADAPQVHCPQQYGFFKRLLMRDEKFVLQSLEQKKSWGRVQIDDSTLTKIKELTSTLRSGGNDVTHALEALNKIATKSTLTNEQFTKVVDNMLFFSKIASDRSGDTKLALEVANNLSFLDDKLSVSGLFNVFTSRYAEKLSGRPWSAHEFREFLAGEVTELKKTHSKLSRIDTETWMKDLEKNPSSPWDTFKGFVADARQRPSLLLGRNVPLAPKLAEPILTPLGKTKAVSVHVAVETSMWACCIASRIVVGGISKALSVQPSLLTQVGAGVVIDGLIFWAPLYRCLDHWQDCRAYKAAYKAVTGKDLDALLERHNAIERKNALSETDLKELAAASSKLAEDTADYSHDLRFTGIVSLIDKQRAAKNLAPLTLDEIVDKNKQIEKDLKELIAFKSQPSELSAAERVALYEKWLPLEAIVKKYKTDPDLALKLADKKAEFYLASTRIVEATQAKKDLSEYRLIKYFDDEKTQASFVKAIEPLLDQVKDNKIQPSELQFALQYALDAIVTNDLRRIAQNKSDSETGPAPPIDTGSLIQRIMTDAIYSVEELPQ